MPRRLHLHRNLPESEKYIWMKKSEKSRFFYISITRQLSLYCNQTLGCLRLYGDSRVSRAQPGINAYEILLQRDWLLFFSRHNRFAETHSHLQPSYHITDSLLAAGNYSRWAERNQGSFLNICVLRCSLKNLIQRINNQITACTPFKEESILWFVSR